MNDIAFMNEFISKRNPHIKLRYALQEEGRLLIEMDRAEQLASTAHERKREENETNKIIAALKKEKHNAYVTTKRHQQLMQNTDELRRLRYYVSTAETAKELVAQLKLQDEKIERRFENAKNQALELRAEYRAAEERHKQIEEQKRWEGKMLRDVLQTQMEEHDMKRAEDWENNIKEGKELRDKLHAMDERDRLQKEAHNREKLKLRQEILENLRQKAELRKALGAKDLTSIKEHYQEQRKWDELQQRIKHFRHWGIQKKAAISAMIGEKTLQKENAKCQAVTNLIDMFVNEHQANEQLKEQLKIEKENEVRRMLHNESLMHLERKRAEKEKQLAINMEIARERRPLKPEEQDRPRGKLRDERKILETKRFMAEKFEIDRERFAQNAEEIRQLSESFAKQAQEHENNVEAAKIDLLNKQSIQLLRYLPSSVVRTDYLPPLLREQVREAVRNDPIPILTKKRHQPHLRGHHSDQPEQVKCRKNCKNPNVLSNIFLI